MTGGLLQLVAKGNEDLYLTYEPQITFFKNVYKRHTNFSSESIPQNFNSKPDFGKKITCTLAKNADLIHKIYVVVQLPKINQIINTGDISNLNKCAWIENIGWNIIKNVEIEIGGYVIDKHYSDWLQIWSSLTKTNGKDYGLNKMIGNVPELTEFTTSKQNYTLYIPLMFWFCNNPGLALPIIALEFSDVKVNIEFAGINDVLLLSPTNYIDIDNNLVHFNVGDILYQKINNKQNLIKFCHFENIDSQTNRLYYSKINNDKIVSHDNTNIKLKDNFKIYSLDGVYNVNPKFGVFEQIYINKLTNFEWVNSLSISSAYLWVDYIFLDIDERIKFIKSNHEYLIDVLIYDNDRIISNNSGKYKFGYSQPCKEIVFRAQMDYLVGNNLLQKSNYCLDYLKKTNIINNVQIIMNGVERLSSRDANYFHYIQPFQHHTNKPIPGLYMYSFSLFPEKHQPGGSCNLSRIDDFQININVNKSINYLNPAKFKVYARGINVLRIINGQAGLAFSN